MVFVDKRPNCMSTYLPCLKCVNRFLIVKALLGAFNKEKVLLGKLCKVSYPALLLSTADINSVSQLRGV